MPITSKLSRKLYETLGDEAAAEMTDWMQRIDSQRAELRELNELNFSRLDLRLAETATRADLAELRQVTQADIAELRQATQADIAELRQATQGDIAELRQATQADIAELRQATQADIAELRQELRAGFAQLEARLERRVGDLMKWSFVFWVGAVAAIAALAGVLR